MTVESNDAFLTYDIEEYNKIDQKPYTGIIEVGCQNGVSKVTKLFNKYPMKLIVTDLSLNPNCSTVYMLGYGGGIVQTDQTKLVGKLTHTQLIMLTQGTTKVYKNLINRPCSQLVSFEIGENASLIMLPDTIITFEESMYHGVQNFYLNSATSSLLLLDWVSGGRFNNLEVWKLKSYYSSIEIYDPNRKILFRDNLVINNDTTLKLRNFGYMVYATLFIIGPQFTNLSKVLKEKYDKETQLKSHAEADNDKELIWSFNYLDDTNTNCIVKVSAKEIDSVRIWLRNILNLGLEENTLDANRLF